MKTPDGNGASSVEDIDAARGLEVDTDIAEAEVDTPGDIPSEFKDTDDVVCGDSAALESVFESPMLFGVPLADGWAEFGVSASSLTKGVGILLLN